MDMRLTALMGLFLILLAGDSEVGGFDIRWGGLLFAAVVTFALSGLPKERVILRSGFRAWLALFLIWLTISALWSPPGARVEERLFDILCLAVFLGASSVCLSRAREGDLRMLWWGIFVVCSVFAAVAMTAATVSSQGRISALGSGPNVFVRIMALGLLSSIMIRRGVILLASAPIFVMLALLSGSRGGVVALSVALLTIAFVVLKWGRGAPRLRSVLVTLAVAGLFRAFVWDNIQEYFASRFVTQTWGEGYASNRDVIVADMLGLFQRYPITGSGLDGYWALIGQTSGYQHPHNMIAAAAGEGGLVGLALLIGALVAGFRLAFHSRDRTSLGGGDCCLNVCSCFTFFRVLV